MEKYKSEIYDLLDECDFLPNQPCRFCNEPDCNHRCSNCKIAYYCNREHQREDWVNHKSFCEEFSRKNTILCSKCYRIVDKKYTIFTNSDSNSSVCTICRVMCNDYVPDYTINMIENEKNDIHQLVEISLRSTSLIFLLMKMYNKTNMCSCCKLVNQNKVQVCSECKIFKNCSNKCNNYPPHKKICQAASTWRWTYPVTFESFENYYTSTPDAKVVFIHLPYSSNKEYNVKKTLVSIKANEADTNDPLTKKILSILDTTKDAFHLFLFQRNWHDVELFCI